MRVLLLMPTTTYRAQDFLSAADQLGVEVIKGTDRCQRVADQHTILSDREFLPLDFRRFDRAVATIVGYAREHPIDAIVAVDDETTEIAALACQALGWPHNDIQGVHATRDKLVLRRRLTEAGLPQARFLEIPMTADPKEAAKRVRCEVGFPCVLKPRGLSASQGVIRVDDEVRFTEALPRVVAIIKETKTEKKAAPRTDSVLIEGFLPGQEVSLEGLLTEGRLGTLALFDKPDPLDGPYFEETIYVTPSRLPEVVQAMVRASTESAAKALGIVTGPIHAELRISNDGEPTLIEIAPRSIGGLCSRTLRFGLGLSLESVILRHALELELPTVSDTEGVASGVLMIPIPKTGILHGVEGVEEALAIPGIVDLQITAALGRKIVKLPEGSAYLGFVFARGESPQRSEEALRKAHGALRFDIRKALPVAGERRTG